MTKINGATLAHDMDAAERDPQAACTSDMDWPEPLGPAAYHGLAGDFVRRVEQHSEADPNAILIQFLVAAGNLIGRGPFAEREAAPHYANLYAVVVGKSAKARKGSSLNHVLKLARRADETWLPGTGLSSGEGLIDAVRDPVEREESVKNKAGKTQGKETVLVDPGVKDKRLLVKSGELAGPLKAMSRQGNTLSAIVREAWDTGDLRTMVKNSPSRATGAHISLLGHITKAELDEVMTECELENGLANRFLWIAARRARLLPMGGDLRDESLSPLVFQLRQAIDWAAAAGLMDFDDAAAQLWIDAYEKLSAEEPGRFGAVTARGDAQALRLSLVYVALDQSAVIRAEHVRAGLEVWRYCRDSAAWIFGRAIGDRLADRIEAALLEAGPGGLARNDIRERYAKNTKAERLTGVMSALAGAGRAFKRMEESTGKDRGRDIERWIHSRFRPAEREKRVERVSVIDSAGPSHPYHPSRAHPADPEELPEEPPELAAEQAALAAAEQVAAEEAAF